VSDYKYWIDLVKEAKQYPWMLNTYPSIFDSPQNITEHEITQVKQEIAQIESDYRNTEKPDTKRESKDTETNWTGKSPSISKGKAHSMRNVFKSQNNDDSMRSHSFTHRKPSARHLESDCPYTVLQISRSAQEPEIKAAYKVLAKLYHPDKNKDPRANQWFQRINEAYTMAMANADTTTR
jgi:DnaJ domain